MSTKTNINTAASGLAAALPALNSGRRNATGIKFEVSVYNGTLMIHANTEMTHPTVYDGWQVKFNKNDYTSYRKSVNEQ